MVVEGYFIRIKEWLKMVGDFLGGVRFVIFEDVLKWILV